MVEIDELGGYLVENGEPFLDMDDGPIKRKIYTMKKILSYCKEALPETKYLQVEKFYMEIET
jgi:hypothetical protein